MSRHVVGITLDNLEHLPQRCRRCVYWELAPHLKEQVEEYGDTEVEKEAWISAVLLEWGSCGRIAYSEELPVGFVLYAPPSAVPRSTAFPTAPVSADAIMLTSFFVLPEFRGAGLGRMLVQAAVQDLTRRGVTAIEAYGDEDPETTSGEREHTCVVAADFLRSVGFKTVHAHARWPRLRLELRAGLSWKEDVEAALDQLLGHVSVAAVGSKERTAGRV
ncbi:GNAT family N-acetyltransferase [Haloechinothrix sp. LS1_15]|uniref:GNAT family N-acetyltransferase n=1 Tax=Haloechinothrix sp. LS1_15 TaxID=2652248 RepID=UPI002945B23E|nr:GNAT family N-acetyltransferase [Haloechinothrix sp. LS1_15]MDV6010981.1 GNAT family N-acetyltransferase [Haloechinothrix sp. LS1_15]